MRAASSVIAMTSAEVLVKGAVCDPSKLGDCPFSQRVLLTLEEKRVPYKATYVDMSNKPQWFLDANPEGKVPVIQNDGKWLADSDVITRIIEEKYPEPSLVTPSEKSSIGSKIFPCFVQFLKSKDHSDGTEDALLDELRTFNKHLENNGPYVCGDKVSAVDLALAPKLYHMKIALGHFRKWSIPVEFKHLISYMDLMFTRDSFEKTKAPEEFVVRGWAKHLE